MRSELLARILIVTGLALAAGVPLLVWARTPLIHARTAENGGWTPNVIEAKVGQPLHLNLTSDDVTHGFAVGGMDMQSAEVDPGKVTQVTLTFDQPGTYTFYCTRWCGINHWRMRGTIEVSGTQQAQAPVKPKSVPLYVSLGLDLDAPHESPLLPLMRPSAAQGRLLLKDMPIPDADLAYYRTHSPYQAWLDLRSNPAYSNISDGQLWDVVALIWQSNTTPEALASGGRLFAQNCAACHGEQGAGDGVFADQLGASTNPAVSGMQGMSTKRPADFTDPRRMLGASPALLQGKILRGGMGTGMPSWGPIFTAQQTWELVSYLYSFQFDFQTQGANP